MALPINHVYEMDLHARRLHRRLLRALPLAVPGHLAASLNETHSALEETKIVLIIQIIHT